MPPGAIMKIGSPQNGCSEKAFWWMSVRLHRLRKLSRKIDPFIPCANMELIVWDGTNRLDTWLTTYLGAEDSNYVRAVGARWLISAIARIYRPGAKAYCCLILEGAQGSKKSTALKTLAGPYFADELADLGTKDSVLQTQGVWIIELSELDSLSRAEVGRIKAFMSRTTDRFRPPYCKRLIESPRQCVFAGSVKHSSYLRDDSGGPAVLAGSLRSNRH